MRGGSWFQWRGRDSDPFPGWLVFKNYARDEKVLIIHTLIQGKIVVNIGEWVHNNAQGDVSIHLEAPS